MFASICRILVKSIAIVALLVCTVATLPALAATSTSDRQPLTLEILQERLDAPIKQEGMVTIDLQNFVIDLRSDNGEFRDRFYSLLQQKLARTGSPYGLDLSHSWIRGTLDSAKLGLRAPLQGDALSPLFSETEREQLQRDRRRLSQLRGLSRSLVDNAGVGNTTQLQLTIFQGLLKLTHAYFSDPVNFSNTFFLDRVEAQGATFAAKTNWSETRFSQSANFTGASFADALNFRNSLFFKRVEFNSGQFRGNAVFGSATFEETGDFHNAQFQSFTDFSRTTWQGNADFSQVDWQDRVQFTKSKFTESLFLTGATFSGAATFREAWFNQPVNLRGATVLELADFSDAVFADDAYLNIADLTFNVDTAKITGDPGTIGKVLSVPVLQGNENLLRNLVRNFREQEQIPDANQIDYQSARLRHQALGRRLVGSNINTASRIRLKDLGFSDKQVEAIVARRDKQRFSNINELLRVDTIDLSTYTSVRDRLIASEPISFNTWLKTALLWLGLSLLILLSQYGTSFWLVFGVGLLAIAYFSALLWLVDRYRRRRPKPIVPRKAEIAWVASMSAFLSLTGVTTVFRTSANPVWTLSCLTLAIVPIPTLLLAILYYRGRYHDMMDSSYFVEDGGLRQLRIMIGRMPIMPRYGFYHDRYMPLLIDRNWNWLNYYDFSLNNLFKFGFNDIRLRDSCLPGLITSLAWYQWAIGLLYTILLLWTLSRTIPGLNLLLYLK